MRTSQFWEFEYPADNEDDPYDAIIIQATPRSCNLCLSITFPER